MLEGMHGQSQADNAEYTTCTQTRLQARRY